MLHLALGWLCFALFVCRCCACLSFWLVISLGNTPFGRTVRLPACSCTCIYIYIYFFFLAPAWLIRRTQAGNEWLLGSGKGVQLTTSPSCIYIYICISVYLRTPVHIFMYTACISMYAFIHVCVLVHIYIYIWSGVWRSPPPPPMVWSDTGGGGWRVRRGVGAVGAAAGETARRHRQGQHSTQALRKP